MSDQVSVDAHLEQSHLAHLRKLQNADGGWGFSADCESRIEPTTWALLALQEFDSAVPAYEMIHRGLLFVVRAQLEDGSWPSVAGEREGSWVTSLACWALLAHREYATCLRQGLQWLNKDRPRDVDRWWRAKLTLTDREKTNGNSSSFSGWSWAPHFASWVEPTCYALIVHRSSPGVASIANLDRRLKLAEAMLWNRMCPGGGWNSGNPRMYGVAGQPQVGPTVWALIALREHSMRPENRQSLDWLENEQRTIQSPESMALAHIGLGLYGRSNALLTERLRTNKESGTSPWTVPAIAWAALAFSEAGRWLNVASRASA